MAGLFPPQRMAVQLDDSLMAEFLSYWIIYNKPCVLTIKPSDKSSGVVGICFTVDNNNTLEFMEKAVSKTGGKLWNLTK
ncbi:MAG: hypothetical protein LUI85_19095 [Bacteroides sp.]|nr:hypothetical protein [Bacteroides sp.]